MTTVKDLFDAMPSKFNPEPAAGLTAVYQFDITGEGGGKWYAAIEDSKLTVAPGEHPSPSMTLTMAAPDYIAMSTGKLSGQMAFMTGKLKVKGDLALAMRMKSIFGQ